MLTGLVLWSRMMAGFAWCLGVICLEFVSIAAPQRSGLGRRHLRRPGTRQPRRRAPASRYLHPMRSPRRRLTTPHSGPNLRIGLSQQRRDAGHVWRGHAGALLASASSTLIPVTAAFGGNRITVPSRGARFSSGVGSVRDTPCTLRRTRTPSFIRRLTRLVACCAAATTRSDIG